MIEAFLIRLLRKRKELAPAPPAQTSDSIKLRNSSGELIPVLLPIELIKRLERIGLNRIVFGEEPSENEVQHIIEALKEKTGLTLGGKYVIEAKALEEELLKNQATLSSLVIRGSTMYCFLLQRQDRAQFSHLQYYLLRMDSQTLERIKQSYQGNATELITFAEDGDDLTDTKLAPQLTEQQAEEIISQLSNERLEYLVTKLEEIFGTTTIPAVAEDKKTGLTAPDKRAGLTAPDKRAGLSVDGETVNNVLPELTEFANFFTSINMDVVRQALSLPGSILDSFIRTQLAELDTLLVSFLFICLTREQQVLLQNTLLAKLSHINLTRLAMALDLLVSYTLTTDKREVKARIDNTTFPPGETEGFIPKQLLIALKSALAEAPQRSFGLAMAIYDYLTTTTQQPVHDKTNYSTLLRLAICLRNITKVSNAETRMQLKEVLT